MYSTPRPSRDGVLSAALVVVAACGTPSAAPDANDGNIGNVGDAATTEDDGVPVRQPCTTSFGNALTSTYGRLDGVLVAIVWPGGSACNSDGDHVLLQIRANGEIYEIAVNVGSPAAEDVKTTTRDIPLPGPAWSEGWHTGVAMDYVAMNVRASDLELQTRSQHVAALMTDLTEVNHVSVYAIGYGPDGAHLVHRNGNGKDGLLITRPLSSQVHARLFAFSNQTF